MKNILNNFPPPLVHQFYLFVKLMDKKKITIGQMEKYLLSHQIKLEVDDDVFLGKRKAKTKILHTQGPLLEKPCCGGGKVDAAVKAFKEKQRKLRLERMKSEETLQPAINKASRRNKRVTTQRGGKRGNR